MRTPASLSLPILVGLACLLTSLPLIHGLLEEEKTCYMLNNQSLCLCLDNDAGNCEAEWNNYSCANCQVCGANDTHIASWGCQDAAEMSSTETGGAVEDIHPCVNAGCNECLGRFVWVGGGGTIGEDDETTAASTSRQGDLIPAEGDE